MGRNQNAQETRTELIDCMGERLGEYFHELWQELAWLNVKWEEYVELFGTKPSRIDLLNRAAPLFFRIVQDTLWEDTLLHICRLTDPPNSVGKATLTIRGLPDLVDAKIRQLVFDHVQIACQKSKFCRDWRNRHIAHRDLALALKQQTTPLAPASRQHVREALGALAGVLNAIDGHYRNTETGFDHTLSPAGSLQLLYVIDDGLTAETERAERVRQHDFRNEDLLARDL